MTLYLARRRRLERTTRISHRPLPMAILAAPFVAIGIGLYANYAAGPGLPEPMRAWVEHLTQPASQHTAQTAPRPHAITLPVRGPVPATPAPTADVPARQIAPATPSSFAGLLDPAPLAGTVPGRFTTTLPATAGQLQAFSLPKETPATPVVAALPEQPAAASATAPAPAAGASPRPSQRMALAVPAPRGETQRETPRVAEGAQEPRTRTASRPRHQARTTVAAAPAPDNRGFFERVFGIGAPSPSGAALGYAAPQDEAADSPRSRRLGLGSTAGDQTAVYDISARTVYLPNGEKLEAHSGLGEHKDDPRSAHIRMKGVTPPHVYDLTMREAPFHGVRALRLNPVGGSGAIHGRDGLLAHTYLLGASGDSNGCVSFRDYDRFLKAYLRGEVRRLVVVASMN